MQIPEYLGPRLDVWRVVKSGMATLHEIETCWSMADVWDACAYLDIEADADMIAAQVE